MRSVVIFLLTSASVFGQISTGALLGRVQNESGATISGAQVSVRDLATGFERTVTSGLSGTYEIDALRPGDYAVSAGKQGFRTLNVPAIKIEVNQKLTLDLELRAGAERDQVTVTAEAQLLQTRDASEGYTLQSSAIQSLPLVGRNIIGLVTVGPGAIPRQLGGFTHDVINDLQGGRGAVAFNAPVNGARSTMNAYVLDGAYNTDRNTFAIAVTPPADSVQEFRIQTSLAPAQFAQAGGAVVDVVTRSGSRQFHGSAYEYLRNEAVDARGLFDDPSLPKPTARQNQFGGTVGGPAGLPSTFFFGAFDGLHMKAAKSTLHLVPDATVRAGDFTGRSPIFDPLTYDPATGTRQPFPNGIIPTNRIDPIAKRFLDLYEPLPNQPAGGGSNYLDATPNTADNSSASGRVDHQFHNQSWLFGRFSFNDEQTKIAGAFPQLPTDERLRAMQGAIGYTKGGNSWVSESRLSYTRLRVFDLPQSAFRKNVISDLGIQQGPTDPFTYGLPYFAVTNFDTVTDSPTLPQVQRDNTWNVSEGISITKGRHTFQTGFQWIHFQFNYLQSQFPRGQYIYSGSFTADPTSPGASGDPFADFLLGLPQTTKRSVGQAQAYLRNNNYAAYFQDDYRITRRLTLNLGLRYEYASPFTEANGNILNLDYGHLPAAPTLRKVNQSSNPDRNDFAPRVGLAWNQGQFVFRAGYGIYYNQEIATEAYDLVRNGLVNEINETTGPVPILSTRNGFLKTASTGFPSYFGLDPNARTPYVQQWSASIQRQLPGAILAEIGYVGTKGTHLGRFRAFNTPLHVETGENLDPRPGDLQSLRTFPELGPIYQRQHIANSIYHSLQLKAEKRFDHGLSFLASFVWAKSIDDADSIIPGQYDSYGAQDERNLRLERGLSFFDVRRRFSAGFVYQLPAPRTLRLALANWQLSGIVTIQDGTPSNPVYFASDFANSGTPNRPNVVPGQNVSLPSNQRSIDEFFNRNAFSDPAPYTFGNAGRNTLPGPANNVFDLGLQKRFPLGETRSAQLGVQAFNAFNHPNLGIPGPYPDFGPFFGRIFSTGDPRRLQFLARFDF